MSQKSKKVTKVKKVKIKVKIKVTKAAHCAEQMISIDRVLKSHKK
jgi:hypothetical protein